MRCAIAVCIDAYGLGHANCIGNLHQEFVCNSCCYQVLCYVARCIGCTAVHLGRILSGERTATVGAAATVSIYDNLTSGKTCISGRATNHELAGGVHVQDEVAVEEASGRSRELGHHLGNQDVANVLGNLGMHNLVCGEFVVLGRKNYGMDAQRLASLPVVLNCKLGFCVRAQVSHKLAFAADVGQSTKRKVGQCKGKRHVVFCLAASVAEHHALVAGALIFRVFADNTAVNVHTLLVDGGKHTAGVGVEHVFRFIISYTRDDTANHLLDIYISIVAADLAADNYQTCRTESLAGHFCVPVLPEELVKDCV